MALNEQCDAPQVRSFVVVRNVIAAAFAVLVLAAGWAVHGHMESHHIASVDALGERAKLEKREAAIEAEHTRLSERRAQMRSEVESLSLRLPLQSDEARVVAAVAKLAESRGLEIQSLRPSRLETAGGGRVDLQIAAVGSYESLCRFLDDTAQMQRVCTVSDMAITAADDAGVNMRIDATLSALFGKVTKEVQP